MHQAAVITVSDSRSRGVAVDEGGPAIGHAISAMGWEIMDRCIVPDEVDAIRAAVEALAGHCALIVTTGGTGIADRDVTPEAIDPILEKKLPGFGEIMRTATFSKTPLSIISRGGAGLLRGTLIVMLPGSPRGAVDCLEILAPAIKHTLKVLGRETVDCRVESGQ